jgi:hypothetical protein
MRFVPTDVLGISAWQNSISFFHQEVDLELASLTLSEGLTVIYWHCTI